MISISVGEAKNKLTYYLHLVEEKGESIQVTRHGKTVATINNQDSSNVLCKKQLFTKGLESWRSKYADELKQYSDEEIDEIFARQKDDEPIVRHPKDFDW